MCIEDHQLIGPHMLEGGAMMGKDYMLAILIVNYDGETHTHKQTHTYVYINTYPDNGCLSMCCMHIKKNTPTNTHTHRFGMLFF